MIPSTGDAEAEQSLQVKPALRSIPWGWEEGSPKISDMYSFYSASKKIKKWIFQLIRYQAPWLMPIIPVFGDPRLRQEDLEFEASLGLNQQAGYESSNNV